MNAILRPTVMLSIALLTAAPLGAQTSRPAAPPASAQPAAPAVDPNLPVPPANYVYSADGRRDPFVSLVHRGTEPSAALTKRPEGLAGLPTDEFAVRGIVQSRGTYAALVAAPNGKVYTIRTGDRLFDGTVSAVTAQYVVVLQEVKDPLSPEKQREVRKFLRRGEEVK